MRQLGEMLEKLRVDRNIILDFAGNTAIFEAQSGGDITVSTLIRILNTLRGGCSIERGKNGVVISIYPVEVE